jgi:hypothetical protein
MLELRVCLRVKIHHNNLHKDMKYTCYICSHQTSSKGGLKINLEENMKERCTHAGNVTTKQLHRVVSLNASEQFTKERSTHASNVTTRLPERVISLNTSERYMKERNTHAENVTTRQLQRVILMNSSG